VTQSHVPPAILCPPPHQSNSFFRDVGSGSVFDQSFGRILALPLDEAFLQVFASFKKQRAVAASAIANEYAPFSIFNCDECRPPQASSFS